MSLEISLDELFVVMLMFFLYCVVGWVWESIYMSVFEKKLQNRGFLHGPYIPVYGFAGILVYFTLGRLNGPFFSKNTIYIYFIGMICATTVEYITAVILDKVFHQAWWDYTMYPLNYKGRICLIASLFWGVVCVLFVQVFNPVISGFFGGISTQAKERLTLAIAAVMAIDTAITVYSIMKSHSEEGEEISEEEMEEIGFFAGKKKWVVARYNALENRVESRVEKIRDLVEDFLGMR